MKIAGLQSLSLMDFPGHPAAIVFTQGCVFRCPYCHNPELIPLESANDAIPERDVLVTLKQRRNLIEGVVITGGEPTIQVGLMQFIQAVKMLGLLVKLDTNGINPLFIRHLLDKNLVDFVAMDLKQRWEKYDTVIRTGNMRAIDNCRNTFKILQSGSVAHEFRTTVCPGIHIQDDLYTMASYLRNGESYILQATQFKKNLTPDLPHSLGFDLADVAKDLQEKFPRCTIRLRA